MPRHQRRHIFFRIVLGCALALVFAAAPADAFLVDGDRPYRWIDLDDYHYIFSDLSTDQLAELRYYNEAIRDLKRDQYNWRLDERTSLVLGSDRNQVINAFVTPLPNLTTVFFRGGAPVLDRFAANSWTYTLLTHETSHLYQLSAKAPFSAGLHSVLGNQIVVFFFIPLPLFIFPNALAPTYLLEGDAVLNESRWGLGGRLYSGEIRATVLQLFKSGKVNPSWMINAHRDYPFGDEKYWVGGHFMAFLRGKFGSARTHSFFRTQAENYFNPLLLNATFERHFGEDLYTLFDQFQREQSTLAALQKSVPGRSLFSSRQYVDMNRVGNEIYLMLTDLRQKNMLVRFARDTQQWRAERTTLSFGNVFRGADGEFRTVRSHLIDHHGLRQAFGLYDDGLYLQPESLNEAVTDERAGRRVYLDPAESFDRRAIYLDGKFFAFGDSSPRLDDKGRVYFFSQNDDERVLLRDNAPLASFTGFYGKIVDVDDSGFVYFVASSEFGSSLYRSNGGPIERVLEYDTIVDARLVDGERALVAQATAEGFDYHVVGLSPRPATPYYPFFGFEDEPQYKTFFASTRRQAKDKIQPLPTARNYYPVTQLRWSSFSPSFGWSSVGGSAFLGRLDFNDPLLWNSLTVFGGRNTFDRDIFSLSYDYRRYRLAWRLLLQYEEAVATDDLEVVARAIDREVQLGFSYPLWLAGRWTLDVAGAGAWERDEKFSGAIVETAFPLLQLRANYARGQSLALLPVSAFSLTTSYREYDTGPAFASRMAWNREVGEAIFGQDSDQELHLSLQQFSSVAQRNELELEPAGGTLEPDTTAGAFDTTAASLRSGIDLQRILKTGLRLTVPFETPIYHRWIPLGLRRLAPYVGTNYFDLTVYDGTETGARSSFVERVAGLSAEILFAHQFPLSLSVEGGTNNKPDQFNLSVHLGANRSF